MPSLVPERGSRPEDRWPRAERRGAPPHAIGALARAKAACSPGAIGTLADAAVGVAVVVVVTAAIALALGVGFVGGARARSGAGVAVVEPAGGDLSA